MHKSANKFYVIYGLMILMGINIHAQEISIDSHFNELIRKNSGGWVAGDATYSIHLPDNRTLWLFGDTFIGTTDSIGGIEPGSTMIRNSAIIMDGDSIRSLYNGTFKKPTDFIATDNPEETWYWPEHGVVENNKLKIFVAKFTSDPDAPAGWNFKHIGQDVAYFSYPALEFIKITELPFYEKNKVMYGPRIIQEQEYTYIYGRKEENLTGIKLPYPHVARLKNGENNNWEFFNGTNWSDNPESTRAMITFAVSQQFGVFKHLNKYVLITQEIWLGAKIYSFTADSPQGPWKNKTLLYETPIIFDNSFTYNAYPHPQFIEKNELLLSYNTNGDFWDIFSNTEIYRPIFIRIPLELIDASFAINSTFEKELSLMGVYPNPVKNQLTISFYIPNKGNVRFSLHHLNGKIAKTFELKNMEVGNQAIQLNIQELKNGIYLGVLSSKNKKQTFKIIKQAH